MNHLPSCSRILASRRRVRGFTLIEIMIVVVIIGVLSAIAIPLYGEYVLRGRIPDATSNLSALAVKMEQGFQDNRSYNLSGSTTKCLIDAATTGDITKLTNTNKSFDFSCVASPATATTPDTFTITAKGKANTMPGFEFTINQSGGKTSKGKTGWTAGTNCWITNKGGC